MKQRVITGLIMALVVVAVFLLRELSNYVFDVAFTIIIIISANEVARVFNRSGRSNDSTLLTFYPVLCYITIFLAIQFNLKIQYVLLINLGLIIAMMFIELLICLIFNKKLAKNLPEETKYSKYALKRVGLTGFLMLYPSFILTPLTILNHIQDFEYLTMPQENINFSLFFLLLIILTTVATDTFAYFIGSLIKGPKLCPFISPNKTISGAIGGVLGGIIFGFVVYGIFCGVGLSTTIIQPYMIVIYSILASIISQIGDIFASYIKRLARTKDYSSVFPGHGGFMDRLDGISFNSIFSIIFFMLLFI